MKITNITALRDVKGTGLDDIVHAAPTDDLRVDEIREITAPVHLRNELPASSAASGYVAAARESIRQILKAIDPRLLVVVGPCSIHDPKAALDYAERLVEKRKELGDDLFIVMRCYFEKPRTTVGWKGLINDPGLDESFDIDRGLREARKLLLDIAELGLPTGHEFLDPISPQYISDLIAWGAIGARTTESQIHRELASGLSCPIGFKNATSGDIQVAVDALRSASSPHRFLGVTKIGQPAIVSTKGNPDAHLILRGGRHGPNYDPQSVEKACGMLRSAKLPERVFIDCSHANSNKDHSRQVIVADDIATQLTSGDRRIIGVMIESNIVGGRQDLADPYKLVYGMSITDSCMSWEETEVILDDLAIATARRKKK